MIDGVISIGWSMQSRPMRAGLCCASIFKTHAESPLETTFEIHPRNKLNTCGFLCVCVLNSGSGSFDSNYKPVA